MTLVVVIPHDHAYGNRRFRIAAEPSLLVTAAVSLEFAYLLGAA